MNSRALTRKSHFKWMILNFVEISLLIYEIYRKQKIAQKNLESSDKVARQFTDLAVK